MADTFETHFSRAIEIAGGSETKLARATGYTQNAIWSARRAGRVSDRMALRIEDATKGKVARWMLRPDLWSEPKPEVVEPQGVAA